MNDGSLFQNVHIVHVAGNGHIADYSDWATGNPSSDVVNMEGWDEALFLVVKGAGAAGTMTLTIDSCDTATPTTATPVAFQYWTCTTPDVWSAMNEATAVGFVTTAGANQMYACRIKAAGLSGTNKYVRLDVNEVDGTATDGTIVCILSKGRYVHEVMDTVLT